MTRETKVIAVIPAKADSSRLPNKNTVQFLGKPLLVHTIEQAKAAKLVKKVYVSTDSKDIAKLAKKSGAQVIDRPSNLCGDVPLVEVYRHAAKSLNDESMSHLLGLQPDHPDRRVKLDEVIAYAVEKGLEDVVSVDATGHKNGSFRLFKVSTLKENKVSVYAGTVQDAATNIHTLADLKRAEINTQNLQSPLTITIGTRKISKKDPTFVIAEAACNHMCKISMAKKLIDKAVASGADAVKFQTYKAEKLVAKDAQSYWSYGNKISQYQYYKNLDKFGLKDYRTLFDYGKKKGIVVFSTPFDVDSASMLNELDMPLFKIASCSINDLKLIRHVARFQKPVILSTGGAELNEIREAVDVMYGEGNRNLIIMACTLSYPTQDPDAHLLRIPSLRREFPEAIIGLSDHTEPDKHMVIPSIAVSLGARAIEKHYTLDRTLTGSGHSFSVDPDCLKAMIHNIRVTEIVLGDSNLYVREAEQKARASARFSVVASKDLKKGVVLTENDLTIKRPGTGILPKYVDILVGKEVLRDIKTDEHLSWDDVNADAPQLDA